MRFPGNDHRQQQYEALGLVLGDTGRGIGLPIEPQLSEKWGRTMGLLAIADDVSEADPYKYTPSSFLDALEVAPNSGLLFSAEHYLAANIESPRASSVQAHFQSKGQEANNSFGLLRYQAGNLAEQYLRQWAQLHTLSRLGQYVDCVWDAGKDAEDLQFSASELAHGALVAALREVERLNLRTWIAFFGAAHQVGLNRYIITKPLRLWQEYHTAEHQVA